MKNNKLFILIIILTLTLTIAGCSSSTPAPTQGVPAPETSVSEDEPVYEYDEVFVTNVTPKLQAMVDDGRLSAERMQEIIAKIKTGEYQKPYVQKILSGEEK